ncbi:MAG TPA: hypothetical protein VM095_13685 [Pyrinomonadaceae bacterium]|nr:hypothetical protein [Pyrinomonadaceae bacterium]
MEKSLRAELEDYLNSRLSGLQKEITQLQSQVNEAFTRILERSRGEAETDTSVTATISEHIRAAHERGIEDAAAESTRTKASSDMAILKAGIEDISEQHSQAEILSTLVNRAASFAPRVAFFVIKNDQAIGWRARGLEGTVGDDAIREIVLPLSADTPLSDVVRSRKSWSGAPGGNAEDYLLLNRLGSDPPQRMISIPLIARGKAAAVLYADSAALDADAINLEAIETLVRVAGMAVELLVGGSRSATSAQAQPSAAAPAVTEEPQAEEGTSEQTPAAEASAQTQPQTWETGESPRPWSEAEGAVTEETPGADRASEASSASMPADDIGEETLVMEAPQVSAEVYPSSSTAETQATAEAPNQQQQAAAPAAGRRWGRGDTELPVEVSDDDERRQHNDARRFARLLVSEIKLYNEQKVRDGRLEGDLYERLREDIDRSRQMYDKRVAPPVAARYDYFYHELVNTLAEGDPSKLGNDYPGQAA